RLPRGSLVHVRGQERRGRDYRGTPGPRTQRGATANLSLKATAAAERVFIDSPAGRLEVAVSDPGPGRRGIALCAHPHPLYGGTLDNKVVQTLAKAFSSLGWCALRVNFRGVGGSDGSYDEGRGELEDFQALADHGRRTYGALPLAIAGFSFGGFVAAAAAAILDPQHLVLVAPAVGRFP